MAVWIKELTTSDMELTISDMEHRRKKRASLDILDMEHRRKKRASLDQRSAGDPSYSLIQIFIPSDIILNILSRLPPSSLGRFRCVCKQWCDLVKDPIFLESIRSKTLNRLKIISRNVNKKRMLSYDFNSENRLQEKPVELKLGRSMYYWFSNMVEGVTCAYGESTRSNIYLLDPVTQESVKLPRRPQECIGRVYDESIGLGFDPSTGVYKVVRIFRRCGSTCCEILTMHMLKSKIRKWRFIGEIPHTIRVDVQPVFFRGALHWKPSGFVDPLALLAFDIKEEKFRWMKPKPHTLDPKSTFLDLKESNERLYLLYSPLGSITQMEVWMLKEYKECVWLHAWTVDLKGTVKSPCEAPSVIDMGGGHFLLKVLDRNVWRWRIYYCDFLSNGVYEIHRGTPMEPILYNENLSK